MNILEIKNLNKQFGGLLAVNDVSFDIKKGDIQAVIGPNGAGKTTLFNLIAGNIPLDSGKLIFNGKHIEGLPTYKIANLGISRTFQNLKLFGEMTVLENVMVGRHTQSKTGFFAGLLNLPKSWSEEREIREKSHELLKIFKIDDLADVEVSNLPFGKQRLVELARGLASNPELFLLDEPAAGLNIYETAEITEVISSIRDMGVTILIIEHDMSLIMDISDDIVVLSSGEKIVSGKPEEIQKNKDVIKIYLGDDNA